MIHFAQTLNNGTITAVTGAGYVPHKASLRLSSGDVLPV
jgi:hypothetical protein